MWHPILLIEMCVLMELFDRWGRHWYCNWGSAENLVSMRTILCERIFRYLGEWHEGFLFLYISMLIDSTLYFILSVDMTSNHFFARVFGIQLEELRKFVTVSSLKQLVPNWSGQIQVLLCSLRRSWRALRYQSWAHGIKHKKIYNLFGA